MLNEYLVLFVVYHYVAITWLRPALCPYQHTRRQSRTHALKTTTTLPGSQPPPPEKKSLLEPRKRVLDITAHPGCNAYLRHHSCRWNPPSSYPTARTAVQRATNNPSALPPPPSSLPPPVVLLPRPAPRALVRILQWRRRHRRCQRDVAGKR